MLNHFELPGNHNKVKIKHLKLKDFIKNELKTLEDKKKLIQDQEQQCMNEIFNFFVNVENIFNSKINELLLLLKSSSSFHKTKRNFEKISKISFNNEMIDDFLNHTNKLLCALEITNLKRREIQEFQDENNLKHNQKRVINLDHAELHENKELYQEDNKKNYNQGDFIDTKQAKDDKNVCNNESMHWICTTCSFSNFCGSNYCRSCRLRRY